MAYQRRRALSGIGIGRAHFGDPYSTVVHRIDRLLGRNPENPYYVVHACRVDHSTHWPGLIAYFAKGRFVGYSYGQSNPLRLATTKGIDLGDKLGEARKTYGAAAVKATEEQGGSYSITARSGEIIGFLDNSPPVTAKSTLATIEAGDVGCPAMTP